MNRYKLLHFSLLVFFCIATTLISRVDAEETFNVLPGDFELQGPIATQRILIQPIQNKAIGGQINDQATFKIADESVLKIEDSVATPLADGETTIQITVGNITKTIKATVSGIAKPENWSFRNDVLPVISKNGCNSGSCHGALAGKGGFRLSLRGYSPENDYHTIAQEARSRRIEIADPASSLLLTKPTVAVPHKGGLRFETSSDEYRIFSEWIAQGAISPSQSDAKVIRIELLPEEVSLKEGQSQHFIVLAHLSNGTVRDVTRWARFTSTNAPVATVDEIGKVDVVGAGGGAITAWYSSKIAVARITSPYDNKIAPEIFANAPQANFIDEMVLNQLQKLNLQPAPPTSDESFIRRVFLDTIGVLPTPEEVIAFVNDKDANKRNRMIDELLNRPEFVDYWTYHWSDLLLINGTRLRPVAVKAYYQWLRSKVEANTPWNELVREIIVSQGSSTENGATNFYALHQDPENMAENASQAFLGLSIACAKCHNHPLEKWTNDQYYAFANLFSRVRAKGWGGDSRNGDGERTLYLAKSGELVQPLTGKPQLPAPLDGESLDFDYKGDRREHLADWMVSPENPYFSRSITNRIWAKLLGVGLVEQADDMRISNAASNEQLLQAAADYLVEKDFDLKQLIRLILQSETYQRSSQPMPGSENDKRFYSRYYPRRLMAEVLLDAISQVTDVPTDFNSISFPGADSQPTDFYPKGTRALQLYDSAVASYFLKTFGRNDREITCECQRSDEPSMVQVLHLSNGDTLNNKLSAKKNRISKLLGTLEIELEAERKAAEAKQPKEDKKAETKKAEDKNPEGGQVATEKAEPASVEKPLTNADLIDQAYLLTLSRHPHEHETQKLLKVLATQTDDDKRILIEDLFWSLISSREFLFNH